MQNESKTQGASVHRSALQFFSDNLVLLGFGTADVAVYQALKELVDNSIDSCRSLQHSWKLAGKDGDIPSICIKITERPEATPLLNANTNSRVYTIEVQDTGTGINENQAAKLVSTSYSTSKIEEEQGSLGKFGIGMKAVVLYAHYSVSESRGMRIVTSSEHGRAVKMMLSLDSRKHKIHVASRTVTILSEVKGSGGVDHGTLVVVDVAGCLLKNFDHICSYLRAVAWENSGISFRCVFKNVGTAQLLRASKQLHAITSTSETSVSWKETLLGHRALVVLNDKLEDSLVLTSVPAKRWLTFSNSAERKGDDSPVVASVNAAKLLSELPTETTALVGTGYAGFDESTIFRVTCTACMIMDSKPAEDIIPVSVYRFVNGVVLTPCATSCVLLQNVHALCRKSWHSLGFVPSGMVHSEAQGVGASFSLKPIGAYHAMGPEKGIRRIVLILTLQAQDVSFGNLRKSCLEAVQPEHERAIQKAVHQSLQDLKCKAPQMLRSPEESQQIALTRVIFPSIASSIQSIVSLSKDETFRRDILHMLGTNSVDEIAQIIRTTLQEKQKNCSKMP